MKQKGTREQEECLGDEALLPTMQVSDEDRSIALERSAEVRSLDEEYFGLKDTSWTDFKKYFKEIYLVFE